jgi:hypothetical protein
MTKPKETFLGSGLTSEEVTLGKSRFAEYRKNYPQLNKLSNLQLLEELIWLECLQERYKNQVGVITKPSIDSEGKTKIEPLPRHFQEAISSGLDQIINLKTKLGLFEDQKVLDAFKDFENLKKKAVDYRLSHPLSFKTTCPHCSKIFFLKRRTDKFEEFKSPFYADDKVLKNDVLHSLYKQGKITKEETADVLGVSPDFVDWLDENIYKNCKSKGV